MNINDLSLVILVMRSIVLLVLLEGGRLFLIVLRIVGQNLEGLAVDGLAVFGDMQSGKFSAADQDFAHQQFSFDLVTTYVYRLVVRLMTPYYQIVLALQTEDLFACRLDPFEVFRTLRRKYL